MDRFVPEDRKLMGARRDKNQNSVPLCRLVHSQPMKSSLGGM
jgi:hypothetical protein